MFMTTDTPAAASANTQPMLVRALLDPARYPDATTSVRMLETHISYVLLTGRFAYKIKKAVNLGFLDFSSLEQRRFYCEEELRLNRRLAPELYSAVVPIGGTPANPKIGSETGATHRNARDKCIEYAVKMLEFPQAALLDRRLAMGELLPTEIDALADRVADFHAQAARTAAGDDYGTPSAVWAPAAENFRQLCAGQNSPLDRALLNMLEPWSRDEYARLKTFLATRQNDGFVRECHGDLHLGNIALLNGTPTIFDCIEFNQALRWIDVLSEVAFLTIDLEERGRPDYAYRFLNRYLEATGDYAGLRSLPFYRVYRALVRAKVAGIRAAQETLPDALAQAAIRSQYLVCARRASLPGMPRLLLMHGVSGSGKTWVSQALLERIGALRLRSDIERKRLHGMHPLARSESAIERGLYAAETTHATYEKLEELARQILQAGFPVIIDAASLKLWQRQRFRSLCAALRVPFRMISCHASEATLHQRLMARGRAGSDASEAGMAVLHHQLQNNEPLSIAEQAESILFDSARDSLDGLLQRIEPALPQ
jgi:aminoglycoside phosphotransferase family enzyme/predicted kinase